RLQDVAGRRVGGLLRPPGELLRGLLQAADRAGGLRPRVGHRHGRGQHRGPRHAVHPPGGAAGADAEAAQGPGRRVGRPLDRRPRRGVRLTHAAPPRAPGPEGPGPLSVAASADSFPGSWAALAAGPRRPALTACGPSADAAGRGRARDRHRDFFLGGRGGSPAPGDRSEGDTPARLRTPARGPTPPRRVPARPGIRRAWRCFTTVSVLLRLVLYPAMWNVKDRQGGSPPGTPSR